MSVLAFTKVSYPYGWLGNMAPFPITYRGERYRTTEALFQCLRFPDNPKIQTRIRAMKSPMGAKMHAKTHRKKLKVGIRDRADLKRMELCLRLKCKQHPQVRQSLIQTGNAQLIEDCTARPKDIEIDGLPHSSGLPFWGAAYNPITRNWEGTNALGVLWMKLRSEFQSSLSWKVRTPFTFIGSQHSIQSNQIMTTQERREQALQELKAVDRLESVQRKIEGILKKAGFTNLEAYLGEIGIEAAKNGTAKPRKTATPAPAKARIGKTKVKRPRVTDEQIAKMKELRGKGLSLEVVAEKVGTSTMSVFNYEKADFKRAK